MTRMKRKRIFISSVQKELAGERAALRDYLRADPLLRRFFDVFLFEDLPASGRRAEEVYLDEAGGCDLYLGLFGNEYGWEDAKGLSPTEREFNAATAQNKRRRISSEPARRIRACILGCLVLSFAPWT